MDELPADLYLELLLLTVFLFLSALFSATETAYFSLTEVDIKRLEKKGFKNIKIIKKLLSAPQRLLIVIIIGNMFVNIFASSIAANVSMRLFPEFGLSISIGIMTFLLLVFGEISPKSIAVSYNERFAQLVAVPISIFSRVISPMVSFIIFFTNRVMKYYGVTDEHLSHQIHEEDLKNVVDVSESEGIIEEDEKELINSVFEFGSTIVREIMMPRPDMISISVDASHEEVLKIIKEHQFSRFPVYEGTVDNIIGMLYIKDLLSYMRSGESKFELRSLLRQAFFIPETKRISHLLKVMQENKMHLAIVVNEYGGTEGLVTMEDIMEEIFGEILDEVDEMEVHITPLGGGMFRIMGNCDLDEIEEEVGIEIPQNGYETISGFMLEKLGKIPEGGETVIHNGIKYKIESVEKNRINSILVFIPHFKGGEETDEQ